MSYTHALWTVGADTLTALITERPPRQRAKGSCLERVLADLLDDVLQGYTTVAEVDRDYGRQEPGTGHRPRRFNTFADYLNDRIRYATDPAVERELRALLAKAAEPRSKSNWRARRLDTIRINKLLDETGRERADRLRELRAELAD